MKLVKTKLIQEAAKQGSYDAESVLKAESEKKVVVCHKSQRPGHKQKDCRKLSSDQDRDNRSDQKQKKTTPKVKIVREASDEDYAFTAKGIVETGS